jgi:hypothetical protein
MIDAGPRMRSETETFLLLCYDLAIGDCLMAQQTAVLVYLYQNAAAPISTHGLMSTLEMHAYSLAHSGVCR